MTRLGAQLRILCTGAALFACASPGPAVAPETSREGLLWNVRQLTFEGRRTGEGYFSADGRRLVFQSEREPGNPFYQIYLMDLEDGAVRRVSPGRGKTTCAWIHPDGASVLFASTHEEPDALRKQEEEIAFRESGQERRYAWDYDEHYELYAFDLDRGRLARLTQARGYDAEASYSPDGTLIAFASNRHAYREDLSEEERARFERDPSSMMEIYLMRADGADVRRLTHTPGYDGGPFFSPDGSRIVWRRFSEQGDTAEILTMNLDAGDERRLTRLGAMSWAPYFHPSGAYVIFATNLHGFGNFELYLVDAEGERAPVRVTHSDGFDGLPVFSPDGKRLIWTSGRGAEGRSQLFAADWDHAAALARVSGRGGLARAPERAGPGPSSWIRAEELRHHVTTLASESMEGRATGTPGERLATEYVAEAFAAAGLEPAGDDGSFFQSFEFTAGVSLGAGNALQLHRATGGELEAAVELELDRAWRPLALSKTGTSEPAQVVFAGYGIVAPAIGADVAYDSYRDLDVEDRWVLALRYLPEDVSAERRQHLNRYSGLRYKAMVARDRGARGLVVVTGPRSQVKDPLVKLAVDVSLAGTSVYAVSAREEVADTLLAATDRSLAALQQALDGGEEVPGFVLPGVALSASIDLVQEKRVGRNVIGRLRSTAGADRPPVVVGAHVDHLGRGERGGSLAREDERGRVHYGADDNASGVAAVLELARGLAPLAPELRRDVILAAWSGEEAGLLGSADYATRLGDPDPHGGSPSREIAAYLNMDMIGRFDSDVYLHGLGSSSLWSREVERTNAVLGLPVVAQNDAYLPTDATSFYLKGVPVLSVFTGPHEDYHTPRDTPDKLDYDTASRIAELIGRIAASVASQDALLDYVAMERPARGSARGGLRVYLGTVPNYGLSDVTGVALSGVTASGPAAAAGLRAGDVIVELAGTRIENVYDYTYAIQGLKAGQPIEIVVRRSGERLSLQITPEPRD